MLASWLQQVWNWFRMVELDKTVGWLLLRLTPLQLQ
jgi:4-hydroxybenzoate polyprenyltransferase